MITLTELKNILDLDENLLDDLVKNRSAYYSSFYIDKLVGYRKICSPHKNLKKVQQIILSRILYKKSVHNNAFGFIPKKSIQNHARKHISQNLILNIDIHDFFPSITTKRIYGVFKSMNYTNKISHILTELCTYEGILPQGAPTSPYLSNLICRRLDLRLTGLAKKLSLEYSRYADDITFSGNHINKKTYLLIKTIIREEGFRINKYKTRFLGIKSRQSVTGLIVNNKVSWGRKNYKKLKSQLFNLTFGLPPELISEQDIRKYKIRLLGKISIYKKVDISKWYILINLFYKIPWLGALYLNEKDTLSYLVNSIHLTLEALNGIVGDVFKIKKSILEQISKTTQNNNAIFRFNLQRLNLFFDSVERSLIYFYKHLSDSGQSIWNNKKHETINMMLRFGIDNDIDVVVLRDVKNLSAYGRHDGTRLGNKSLEASFKYGFIEELNNYDEVYMNVLKSYSNMLKELLAFCLANKS